MRRFLLHTFMTFAVMVLLPILVIWLADVHIRSASTGKIFDNPDEIDHTKLAVVPGTAKFTLSGRINLYYQYRLDAALKLWERGLIDYILVSGDNSDQFYDEPTTMKNDLIRMGIPPEVIYRDGAGLRTMDSVLRAKYVFDTPNFIFVSQPFQNERAIYIGRSYDIDIIGFNARDVTRQSGLRTQARERAARLLAILEVNILPKKPTEFDEHIPIGVSPAN